MSLLDWIYPPICMACRNILPAGDPARKARGLCAPCEALLVPIAPPVCVHCGQPSAIEGAPCYACNGKSAYFTRNFAAYAYEGVVRDLMHAMKFRHKRPIATGFGVLLAEWSASQNFGNPDYIVPVPMHPRKEKKRGFNQAVLMAAAVAQKNQIPLAADMLCRTRNTPPQSGLSPHQRAENMQNAFKFNPKHQINKAYICLIDDIYTTGATLNTCAKVLLENGAAHVSCLTFSVAVKNKV